MYAEVSDLLDRPATVSGRALRSVQLAVARAGKRLVSVGERGTVLLSDDDGRTWRQAKVPVSLTLTCVCFASERSGWAAGHSGVVLRTSDGGETWVKQLDGRQAAQIELAAAKAAA
ncbi:MAG: glycosyl hydrolase, partial [Deltaproteobacteria bacterium]|nr:glycosyl hydrolase [Deltaproteobacteria bacterium]